MYVPPALEERGSTYRLLRARSLLGALLAAAAASALAACGGGDSQAAGEPEGDFPVEVVTATFPEHQRVADTSELRLGVRNTGEETIPDLALTIFTEPVVSAAEAGQDPGVSDTDVSPGADTPVESEGDSAEQATSSGDDSEVSGTAGGSFSIVDQQPDLAIPYRPVWVLESGFPKLAGEDASAGAATALSNTYSFGSLDAGDTLEVVFKLTAVQSGDYTVNYRVAASLYGKSVAVTDSGGVPEGRIDVRISDAPAQTRVNAAGEVVEISKGEVEKATAPKQTEVSPP